MPRKPAACRRENDFGKPMAQTTLETRAASQYAALVTLSYGDKAAPTIRRYTSWTNDLVVGGQTFISEPLLDIELPEQTGGVEMKEGKLTCPSWREPFDLLSTGFGFSKVWVKIDQVDPSNIVATFRNLNLSSITKVRKNPGKRKGLSECTLANMKLGLNGFRLSLPMTSTCCVPFGGDHCRKDASALEQTGTVASIGTPQRNSVTLVLPAVLDPVSQLPDNKFAMGTLQVNGRSFRIVKSYESLTFDLNELAPPWIVGQACKIYPGCRKRLEDCRVWDNEINFMGLGIKIPARNPVFEQA